MLNSIIIFILHWSITLEFCHGGGKAKNNTIGATKETSGIYLGPPTSALIVLRGGGGKKVQIKFL